jgi:glutathione S-transferase
MSLTLYSHPLASFCHKVLVALYENATPFEARLVDLADEASSAKLLSYWPVGKMPMLRDDARDRTVPETSIIIEYLDRHYRGPVRLLPDDPDAALEARLWDRFFDLYVQTPMQAIVGDQLRPPEKRDALAVDQAKAMLAKAYAHADARLAKRTWAGGEAFGIADGAAAPALFYAGIVEPFAERHANLAAYFERLVARPSFARVLVEARPYFPLFPLRERIPPRFLG